jgi:AraC-like DNA-binding protein
MLIQVLRVHLADGSRHVMHAEPARIWTLEEIARRVGMSRTTFAVKFKKTVGLSPIGYLTRWRMLLAGDRLANTQQSIAEISSSLGYESESAFGAAFKRVMDCSPRQYGRSGKILGNRRRQSPNEVLA